FRGGSVEAEDLAGSIALAPPAVPDGHARPAMDLPRPVAPDEGRLLVDAEHARATGRLQRDERGHRLRPEVVMRDDRRAGHEPEPRPPAHGPGQKPDAEVEGVAGEDHRPGRAAGKHGASLVRVIQGPTD